MNEAMKKEIADAAEMIVGGFSFTRKDGKLWALDSDNGFYND